MNAILKTDKLLKVEDMSEVKEEKERVDGKKRREYYTLLFSDANNPLITKRTRNFFQSHSDDGTETSWRGATPNDARNMIGTKIKGEIMKVIVEPYAILDSTGVERSVNSFTIVAFDGELIPEIVKSYGQTLAGEDTPNEYNKSDNNTDIIRYSY